MSFFSHLTRRRVVGQQLWPVMPLAVGVVCSQLLAWFIPLRGILWALVLVGALGMGASRVRVALGGVFLRLLPSRIGGFLGGVIFGLVSCVGWHLSLVPLAENVDAHVLMEVVEAPRHPMPGAVSFYARVVEGGSGVIRCRAVDLPWRNSEGLRKGDVIRARGKMTPLTKPQNPFSWEGYLYRRGVVGELKVAYLSTPVARSSSFLESVRTLLRNAAAFGGELGRGGALFLSMAFGVHDVLSARVEDAFKSLGLSHILVVSGYQVSLVFGVVCSAFGAVQRMLPIVGALRHAGGMVGFLVAALYVSIIGFEMSATRALIAASCVCAGLLMDRAGGFGQRWWVALLLMHVVFPWATYEIGVLLTFAALAGIGVGARLGQGRAFVTWMWVNVSVWVFTSLILIPATGTISLLGLVLNLLIPAPWSVLNCTLGVMGLVGCLLDVPGGATLLNMVFWVNEHVAALLIAVRDSIGGSAQCEDVVAGVATVGFVALSIGLVARATRTPPSLRCLVRCGA